MSAVVYLALSLLSIRGKSDSRKPQKTVDFNVKSSTLWLETKSNGWAFIKTINHALLGQREYRSVLVLVLSMVNIIETQHEF